MKLTIEDRVNFVRIEKLRVNITDKLNRGIITELDIMNLFNQSSNYGIDNLNCKDYKARILSQIYNSPFILCDVENLSLELKKELDNFLYYRYNMELEELDSYLELGQISNDEYLDSKELLKLHYFGDSKESPKVKKKAN